MPRWKLLLATLLAAALVSGFLWLTNGASEGGVARMTPTDGALPASPPVETKPVLAPPRESFPGGHMAEGSQGSIAPPRGVATPKSESPSPTASAPAESAEPGFAVIGVVITDGSRPLPGAQLVLQATLFPEPILELTAVADDEGKFRIQANELSQYLDVARWGHTVTVTLGATFPGHVPVTRHLPLEDAEGGEIQVEHYLPTLTNRALQARCVDRSRVGVQRLSVRASLLYGSSDSFEAFAQTDNSGFVSVRGLPESGTLRVEASHPEHGRWECEVELDPNQPYVDLGDIQPEASGVLAGTVNAPDGLALEGVPVSASRPDHPDASPLTVQTDSDGTFRLAGLDPQGNYQLTWADEESDRALYRPSRQDLALVSSRYGLVVEVIGAGGRPEPRADVNFVGPGDSTWIRNHRDGTHAVQCNAAGPLDVTALAVIDDQLWTAQAVLELGSAKSPVQIRLEERRLVKVRIVVLGEDGEVIPDSQASLRYLGARSYLRVTSDLFGDRSIKAAPPGRYAVSVHPAPGSMALPFETEIEVPDVDEWTVEVQAPQIGGVLNLEIEGHRAEDLVAAVITRSPLLSDDDIVHSEFIQAPDVKVKLNFSDGTYELRLVITPGEDQRILMRKIELRSGETTHVRFKESEWR